MSRQQSPVDLVGYQVRTPDGQEVVGIVEAAHQRGLRLAKVPLLAHERGYVPLEAVRAIEHATNTVFLAPGVGSVAIAAAPRPAEGDAEHWHMSEDWWADLLGHYGLYDPAGQRSEPFLHADQR